METLEECRKLIDGMIWSDKSQEGGTIVKGRTHLKDRVSAHEKHRAEKGFFCDRRRVML